MVGLQNVTYSLKSGVNYYPFGMKHEGYNTQINSSNPALKYKYNGKEFQDEMGLNMYDFGARLQDPALGRWFAIDPLAETSRRWSPYTYCYNNPMRFVDPDGMLAKEYQEVTKNDDWINYINKEGKQAIVYDAEIKTKEQAEAKGYSNVENVFSSTTATNTENGDKLSFNADGTYSVNGGNSVSPAKQSYSSENSEIGVNQSALSQIAPVISNTGDLAVVVGTAMVLTGVGAPIGAGLIAYGGYAGTVGGALDLVDNYNTGTLTVEKGVTKLAFELIPMAGSAGFKSLGAPAAGELFNVGTMTIDKVIDGLRDTKTGPFR